MGRSGGSFSSGTKYIPSITYQTLFGGEPIHYHREPTDGSVEWRVIEVCKSPDCRALITNCHCGFVYRLDAIENWIKKEQPTLLQAGDNKLPTRNGDCKDCSNTCSRCHQKKKEDREKLHVDKGIERKLCPAHAKMGDPAKREAEALDDYHKAVTTFEHLWKHTEHANLIRGQGGHDAFGIYQKQANRALDLSQPRPDGSAFIKDYLEKQRPVTQLKQAQIAKVEPHDHDSAEYVTPFDDLPPASDPDMREALDIFNDLFPQLDYSELQYISGPGGVNPSSDSVNNTSRATSLPPQQSTHAPTLPRFSSDPTEVHDLYAPAFSANYGDIRPLGSSHLQQPISDPVTRATSASLMGYRESLRSSDDDEEDVPMDCALAQRKSPVYDSSLNWANMDLETEREFRRHLGVSPPREMSGDSGIPSIDNINIVTPVTYPGTVASRLAGSFMSKYPKWQRNVYKPISMADPDSRTQLPDHLEVSDVEYALERLPKILYKGFFDTVPTAYIYDVNAACIKLFANHTPALPKKDDPYNTPLPRAGSRRHYFHTVTLHFGQFWIERDGRLIEPERVHLRWVHEYMSWVVCEVLEGEGQPTRILNLLEARVNLLLDLKDSQGSRMIHRARIDCAHQGCPLHCEYTRIFTGVIAIVVVTAERACLQAYRSQQWEELDKRRKVFYRAMEVAAKLMDCNSVNFYRILEQLDQPYIPPEERENMIIRCKIYDGIIEKIDRLYFTFVDYGVIQKEHDDIEREFLMRGGRYFGWSTRYAQRELDFAKSWNEFNEYINDPNRPIVPCHELFTVPKDEMADSAALKNWEAHVGKDYLKDVDMPVKENYEDELALNVGTKR
ncbi:hypothetical protein I204_04731 [Kwoniella mangroviensis CBS 8886]|nr:hypothetical protein I204_04731 [Kwoniella mangroviensis CBS 8886]